MNYVQIPHFSLIMAAKKYDWWFEFPWNAWLEMVRAFVPLKQQFGNASQTPRYILPHATIFITFAPLVIAIVLLYFIL